MKKKRPPIKQLLEAGKVANKMLKERGLISEQSAIDDILNKKNAPTLPGIPAYLPHRWTLKAAQRVMYDLLIEWQEKTKNSPAKRDNVSEFFKFVLKRLNVVEHEFAKEVVNMPNFIKKARKMKQAVLLRTIFSPLEKRTTAKAMKKFFVDSFAVAIIVKQNDSTTSYVEWFLDWTNDMYNLWGKDADSKSQTNNI